MADERPYVRSRGRVPVDGNGAEIAPATAAGATANGVLLGAVTETAPASDTASSGLNGRLQRVAQRLTSLIAQIPASLGIKTAANSLSIAPASDATFAVSQTGGNYTDRSIANLSGSSETLMAANTARRILIVVNESATAIAVNLTGGTAALNTAGSVTLSPGGNLVIDTYPPTSLIKVIGTANADVTAYEG